MLSKRGTAAFHVGSDVVFHRERSSRERQALFGIIVESDTFFYSEKKATQQRYKMGREMTNEKPVIMDNSIFIISSFLALSCCISSRVMSRVSINDKSSLGLSFLPKTNKTEVVVKDGFG